MADPDLSPPVFGGRDVAPSEVASVPVSYTNGMKTAVSLPDDLFLRADELARRLGKSRSQLYREALAEYLLRREPRSVTTALDLLVDELGPEPDAWTAEAGRRALERSEW